MVSILSVMVGFGFPGPGQHVNPAQCWVLLDATQSWRFHCPCYSMMDLFPSSLSSKYFSINLSPFPISCLAGTEAPHPLLLSVSSLPLPAQGDVSFQDPFYSPGPCFIPASIFLLPAPLVLCPSLVQIHNQVQFPKSGTDVSVMEP